MSRQIHLTTHLSVTDLEQRYRAADEPHERTWWQMLWLLAKGQTSRAIAESTGYTRAWIGQIAKRYNEHGPDSMHNRRHTTSWRAAHVIERAAGRAAPRAGWTGSRRSETLAGTRRR